MSWSVEELERLLPPQVRDARGRAFVQVAARLLASQLTAGPHLRDPDTCPAAVLPALIAELSMEEFIDPAWPEHVQRRILKRAWELQTSEGYDSGVELGLSLLGMTAAIEHWWQKEPKGPPNTQTVTFDAEEQLFETGQAFFREREIQAAFRMVGATKRFSQDTAMVFAENVASTVQVGAAAAHQETVQACLEPMPPTYTSTAATYLGAASAGTEISCAVLDVTLPEAA